MQVVTSLLPMSRHESQVAGEGWVRALGPRADTAMLLVPESF